MRRVLPQVLVMVDGQMIKILIINFVQNLIALKNVVYFMSNIHFSFKNKDFFRLNGVSIEVAYNRLDYQTITQKPVFTVNYL